ncbi:DsrE family protein [Mangrovicoccus sp. HB161399]|uniref:DsrE family protein n=1 Tax=Mangrovicoccus sp. HB161399 TaxID=2720392 RepID=UPI0015550687|nr:DsrE family protein [Mangrovicoccus sp. HB161399]
MKRAILAAVLAASPALAETHYLAIHVDENDPQVMNMALNNAQNVASYYAEQGDDVVIELVAYGPGLNMLVKDKSPVADRIATMSLEMPNIRFDACGNTHAAMSAKAGHDIELVDEAEIVPSGVVKLMELQKQGYAYVRP